MADVKEPKEPTLQEVVKAIGVLNGNVNTVAGALQKLMKGELELPAVVEMKKQLEAKPPPPTDDKKDDKVVDPETMNNAELTQFIVEAIQEKALKPITEQVKSIEEKFETYKAGLEVDGVRGKQKDFDHFQPEIIALQKKHPTLPVEDLLTLARARSPEKVKEFEKKDKELNPPKEEMPKFAGLFPTSTVGKENTAMKFEDSAQKAWEQHDMDAAVAAVN